MSTEVPHELRDFRNFLFLCWRFQGLPEPTKAQYALAHRLQYGPRSQINECFRGKGKSWILAAYVCWLLLFDQSLNILVLSATDKKAGEFTHQCLNLIRMMPELAHLAPRKDQRQSTTKFDVNGAPISQSASVTSVPVLGTSVGSRADIIIADDVEVPNNSETVGMRDKLFGRTEDFQALLKPEGPRRVIWLGTPHSEDSIYNRVHRERGTDLWIWPARYPDERLRDHFQGCLAPELADELDEGTAKPGEPTDPQRFDEEMLHEKEAHYGPSGWALQFMLDTSLADLNRHPLKLSDLIVMDLDKEVAPEKVVYGSSKDQEIKELPNVGFGGDRYYKPMQVVGDMIPYQGSVMAVDPSGRGSDETAVAVVNMLNGQLYCLECKGIPGGYSPETLGKIAALAKEFKVNEIVVEANFGDGMFLELLKPVLTRQYPVTVTEVKHHMQKEKRIIDVLEPIQASHKLVMSKRVVQEDRLTQVECPEEKRREYQLFFQMTRLTKDRGSLNHDDRLDALAMAVGYWTERMGRDADEAIKDRQQMLLEQELESYFRDLEDQHPRPVENWLLN